jgi:hypothetical protein
MTRRRARTSAVVTALAGALLVVVLAAWASSIGPSGVLRGDGPTAAASPSAEASDSASAAPEEREPPEPAQPRGTPPWVRAFVWLVNIAVVVGLVVLAARFGAVPLVRSTRRRRAERRRRNAGRLEFEVLEPADAIARELLAGADDQRRLLVEDSSPRNAVVACWDRFETQAAAAGLARAAWETSAEYTMRVLDMVDADQPAVSRLGELYREARFSEHPVTEEHRREALAALDAIHRTLRRPAGVGT